MANISGTNVAAKIAPFTTEDTYATHVSTYGQGGWHEVTTTQERDAIPADRRIAGMAVLVTSESKLYTLNADLTTWTEFESGGDSATWGNITGTLSDQTDLKNALDLTLRTKDTAGTGSFIDTNAGTSTYPTTGTNLTNSIIIGAEAENRNNTETAKSNNVVIGKSAYTSNSAVTAIGASAKGEAVGCTAIGYSASAMTNTYGTAVGSSSYNVGQYGIAIGNGASNSSTNSIAIGRNSAIASNSLNGIAIGHNSKINSNKTGCIAIGYGATCSASNAFQLGNGTNNNASSLQFKNYPLVDGSGFIYDERLHPYIQFAKETPFVLENTRLETGSDDSVEYALLYTGRTNSVYTQNKCYKSAVNYSYPSAHIAWVNEDMNITENDIIVDQTKFFTKLAEISRERINDDDDYYNGVVGGGQPNNTYYFYHNDSDDTWYMEIDEANIESWYASSPDSVYEINDITEFGIYLPDNIQLPEEDDAGIFDISYNPPVGIIEADQQGTGQGDITVDYAVLMNAMCSDEYGFGVEISDMQTWEYEVDGNTYYMPILPKSYYTGTPIQTAFSWYGEEWTLTIGSTEIASYTTEVLGTQFGIHITDADEIGAFYLKYRPARRLYWEEFNIGGGGVTASYDATTKTITFA